MKHYKKLSKFLIFFLFLFSLFSLFSCGKNKAAPKALYVQEYEKRTFYWGNYDGYNYILTSNYKIEDLSTISLIFDDTDIGAYIKCEVSYIDDNNYLCTLRFNPNDYDYYWTNPASMPPTTFYFYDSATKCKTASNEVELITNRNKQISDYSFEQSADGIPVYADDPLDKIIKLQQHLFICSTNNSLNFTAADDFFAATLLGEYIGIGGHTSNYLFATKRDFLPKLANVKFIGNWNKYSSNENYFWFNDPTLPSSELSQLHVIDYNPLEITTDLSSYYHEHIHEDGDEDEDESPYPVPIPPESYYFNIVFFTVEAPDYGWLDLPNSLIGNINDPSFNHQWHVSPYNYSTDTLINTSHNVTSEELYMLSFDLPAILNSSNVEDELSNSLQYYHFPARQFVNQNFYDFEYNSDEAEWVFGDYNVGYRTYDDVNPLTIYMDDKYQYLSTELSSGGTITKTNMFFQLSPNHAIRSNVNGDAAATINSEISLAPGSLVINENNEAVGLFMGTYDDHSYILNFSSIFIKDNNLNHFGYGSGLNGYYSANIYSPYSIFYDTYYQLGEALQTSNDSNISHLKGYVPWTNRLPTFIDNIPIIPPA